MSSALPSNFATTQRKINVRFYTFHNCIELQARHSVMTSLLLSLTGGHRFIRDGVGNRSFRLVPCRSGDEVYSAATAGGVCAYRRSNLPCSKDVPSLVCAMKYGSLP